MTVHFITSNAGPLLEKYDVLICDIWGVLHNGITEYQAAGDALERFRQAGGTVILLSNAPATAEWVAEVLESKTVRQSAWDAIISAGDLARHRIRDIGAKTIHHIGPTYDHRLFQGFPISTTDLGDADAIVATGLTDDRSETAEDYRHAFEAAQAANLPLIIANPDRVVDVGATRLPCAGVLGDLYESMGGEVYWEGKPSAHAYDAAIAAAEHHAPRSLDRKRIAAVGDSIATDLTGAENAGLDFIFIAQGIHHDTLMTGHTINPDRLAALLAGRSGLPIATLPALAW